MQTLVGILEQAQAIGREHARDEAHERGISWGGNFGNLLSSAWDIVTNFVSRIGDWVASWKTEHAGQEPTEAETQEKIEGLANTVANVEVQSAVEQAATESLRGQGHRTKKWHIQPGACAVCKANAAQGSIPIGEQFESGDEQPPAHDKCGCSVGPGDE